MEMNQRMDRQELLEPTTSTGMAPTDQELLAQWGFTPEEITSMLWLQRWYQIGGSDRALIIRHLEFLRLLVKSGELEL